MAKVVAITVELNGVKTSIDNIEDLTAAIKQTKKELSKEAFGSAAFDKLNKQAAALGIAMQDVREDAKQAGREFTISADKGQGSYKALNAELNALRNKFRELSEAERNSKIGQDITARVQVLDKQLKSIDASLGQYQRNVGNYKSALLGFGDAITGGLASGGPAALAAAAGVAIAQGAKAILDLNIKIQSAAKDVQKVSDLTDQQISQLVEGLKKLNTPTTLEGLLKIGEGLGQLGVAVTPETIASIDKLNIALGSEFGGNTKEIATQVGILKNLLTGFDGVPPAEAFLKIGNALNVLGATGAATAPVVIDMSQRIAGLTAAAKLSDAVILGTSATLQELGVSAERGASGFAALIGELTTDPERVAKVFKIGREEINRIVPGVQNFAEAVNKDAFGALQVFLNKIKEGKLPTTEFSAALKEAGINGAAEREVLGKLSENQEYYNGRIKETARGLKEISSINKEVNSQNDTLQSQLDILGNKIKNIFVDGDFAAGLTNIVKGINYLIDNINIFLPELDILEQSFNSLGDSVKRLLDDFGYKSDGTSALTALFLGLIQPIRSALNIFIGFSNTLDLIISQYEKLIFNAQKAYYWIKSINNPEGLKEYNKFLQDREELEAKINKSIYERQRILTKGDNRYERKGAEYDEENNKLNENTDLLNKNSNGLEKNTDKTNDNTDAIEKQKEKLKQLIKEFDNLNNAFAKNVQQAELDLLLPEERLAKEKELALERVDEQVKQLAAAAKAAGKEIDIAKKTATLKLAIEKDYQKKLADLIANDIKDRRSKDEAAKNAQLKAEEEYQKLKLKSITEKNAKQDQKDKVDAAIENLELITKETKEARDKQRANEIKDAEENAKALKNLAINTAETLANTLLTIEQQNADKRKNAQLTALEKEYNRRIELAEGNEEEKQRITEEFEAKKAAIEKESAKKRKDIALKEAVIYGALNVIKNLDNVYLAIAAGVAAAAQIAIIANTEFAKGGSISLKDKFAKGGTVKMGDFARGRSHANGGIQMRLPDGRHIEIEDGEFVDWDERGRMNIINARSSSKFRRELQNIAGKTFAGKGQYMSDLNSYSGFGKPFATGGSIPAFVRVSESTRNATNITNVVLSKDDIKTLSSSIGQSVQYGSERGSQSGTSNAISSNNRLEKAKKRSII